MCRFVEKDDGQTYVEYALLLFLIALVLIALVTAIGQWATNIFNEAAGGPP